MPKRSVIAPDSGYVSIPQEDFVQLGKDLVYITKIAANLGCSEIEVINASATFQKISEELKQSINNNFDSSRLNIGEMMICNEQMCKDEVLLRCYCSIISLTEPTHTWTFKTTSDCPKLIGRKLFPGESITLTQE